MNAVPPKKSGPDFEPDGEKNVSPGTLRIQEAIAALRDCRRDFEEALRNEGVDIYGPLGSWSMALAHGMDALASIVEASTDRVEGRSAAVEVAMRAEIDRVKAAVDYCRAETLLAQERTRESEEVRKVNNQALARELGEGITKTIKRAAMVREVRLNRVQNWSSVMLGSCVIVGMFVGGAVWASYRSDHAILAACLKAQQTDVAGKVSWCPMVVVQGAG